MPVRQTRSKKGIRKSGRHTPKDLELICPETPENFEEGDLDTKIMQGMAVLGKLRENEINRLLPYVGPDYSSENIERRMRVLVKEEKLRYDRKFYRVKV
jgi:hypothetical protein